MRNDMRRRHVLAAAGIAVPGLARAAGEDILVGQIGPFTGTPVPAAPEVNQGIKAAFAQVNAAGGIHGRRLALFELDDGFKEDQFVTQFGEAMKRRPVALLSPVGTEAVQRMLNDRLLDQADTVVINAIPGAENLRSPGHPRLFHIRASDRRQVEQLIRNAVTLGVKQMAVLHQDLSIGQSGLAAAQKVADGVGVKLMPFMATAKSVQEPATAAKIATSGAQSVLVVGSPAFAAHGIVAMRKARFANVVYALSYVPTALVMQLADRSEVRGIALAQVYPNPNGRSMLLQHDFQAAMKSAGSSAAHHSAFQLEGYVAARVLAEGLRKTRDLTPAGLARALRAMGEFNLGGYHVNFAKDNVGSNFVDVAVLNSDGRLVY